MDTIYGVRVQLKTVRFILKILMVNDFVVFTKKASPKFLGTYG